MEEKKLDLKDKKILAELDLNSRQPISAIAKKIRLNKNTTNFRINRLIKEGFIENFYTAIDISKLGYISIRAYFNFTGTDSNKESKIIKYLIHQKEVVSVAQLETGYDIMISLVVKDIYEFENLWNKFKLEFRNYFSNEKINFFTKVVHNKRKYLSLTPNSIRDYEVVGGSKKEEYDELDFKILSLLTKNARASSLEINKKLNIPQRTIIDRIKKLEKKKIIQGYRTNLNLDKMDREYYKVNFRLCSLKDLEKLRSFFEKNVNTIFIDYTLSDYDFEADVEVKNKAELNEIIKELKDEFKIRSFEILTFKKYYKLESLPSI